MQPKISPQSNFGVDDIAQTIVNFAAVIERAYIKMGIYPDIDMCMDKSIKMFTDYMVKLKDSDNNFQVNIDWGNVKL